MLRTTGMPATRLGFATWPTCSTRRRELLPGLPEPQADALRVALGLAAAELPLAAALLERAVVAVLRELAEPGVMVAVDDEQWVDQDSPRLLEAAVVRLEDAPVRWLVAVRSGHTGRGLAQVLEHELGPRRVTRVDLAGLDDAALSELVMARFPGRWSPGVLRRVVALAAGSPYAALELARETAARGGRDGQRCTCRRRWPTRCAAASTGSARGRAGRGPGRGGGRDADPGAAARVVGGRGRRAGG